MARLRATVADPAAGVVKRGRAANNLNGLENEDPLPLRKAKITAEAALRKLQKREAAAAARADEAAEQTARCQAKVVELGTKEVEGEQKEAALAAAIEGLEASYADLSAKMTEAQAAIEELKLQKCGLGAVWWMERELYEADESLPRARQKYDHSKPLLFDAASAGTMVAGLPEVESSTDADVIAAAAATTAAITSPSSTSALSSSASTSTSTSTRNVVIHVDTNGEHGALGFKIEMVAAEPGPPNNNSNNSNNNNHTSVNGSGTKVPTVKAVSLDGPAVGKLSVGDTIFEINGVATSGMEPITIGGMLHDASSSASSIAFTVGSSTRGDGGDVDDAMLLPQSQRKLSMQNLEVLPSAISG